MTTTPTPASTPVSTNDAADAPRSAWHEGELAMQRAVGVADRMDRAAQQLLRKFMPEQHRAFYPQLPFVVLGAVDPSGDVWATLRAGHPGFMRSPVPTRLHLALEREPADPADGGMNDGDAIGMLGIELHTRRRNRLNGTVRRSDDAASGVAGETTTGAGFEIEVGQAYGNCLQYIQLRDFAFVDQAPQPVVDASVLDDDARMLIGAADSFYVASYVERDGERQVDVSHRGGKPGFVRIEADGTLTVPDFAGNLFFNTLGNFLLNPRAGLVFVDFRTGALLQMTGRAEVLLDAPEIAAFQGAERLWRFHPQRIVRRPGALPLRWKDKVDGASPNSLMTGSWDDAQARLKASALADQWRPFRIERTIDESAQIRSFYLTPDDGAGMPAYAAGQHLPIRLTLPGQAAPVIRHYTLSSAPADGMLRISVKRKGRFSSHLHEHLKAGDVIEARAPDGGFTIDAAERRPAVLLGAGVGMTPLLSMARHMVRERVRKRFMRPVWLFQSARSRAERPFDREVAALVDEAAGRMQLVRLLSRIDGAQAGKDFDEHGRIDIALLKETLPFDDYDFYLCGPTGFMQDIYDGLRGMNIADNRIHAESFGPAGLQRTPGTGEAAVMRGGPVCLDRIC